MGCPLAAWEGRSRVRDARVFLEVKKKGAEFLRETTQFDLEKKCHAKDPSGSPKKRELTAERFNLFLLSSPASVWVCGQLPQHESRKDVPNKFLGQGI